MEGEREREGERGREREGGRERVGEGRGVTKIVVYVCVLVCFINQPRRSCLDS